MNTCVHVHKQIDMHACTQTHMHLHLHTHTHTKVCTYTHHLYNIKFLFSTIICYLHNRLMEKISLWHTGKYSRMINSNWYNQITFTLRQRQQKSFNCSFFYSWASWSHTKYCHIQVCVVHKMYYLIIVSWTIHLEEHLWHIHRGTCILGCRMMQQDGQLPSALTVTSVCQSQLSCLKGAGHLTQGIRCQTLFYLLILNLNMLTILYANELLNPQISDDKIVCSPFFWLQSPFKCNT